MEKGSMEKSKRTKSNNHTENLPHQCEHCGFKSLTEMGIKNHVGKYHSEAKKSYPCKNGCGRFFAHNFMATKHAKHHCDLNPEGKAIPVRMGAGDFLHIILWPPNMQNTTVI